MTEHANESHLPFNATIFGSVHPIFKFWIQSKFYPKEVPIDDLYVDFLTIQ